MREGFFNPLRLPDLLPASPAGKGIGGQQGLLGQLDEPLPKVGEIAVPAVAHHQLADGGGIGQREQVQLLSGSLIGRDMDGL